MAYGAYHPRNPRGQQRDKLYRDALRMELAREDEGVEPGPFRKLREIARVHVEKARAGDMQAIKELRDTLDGRPAQILEHAGTDHTPVGRIEIRFIEEPEPDTISADYQEVKAITNGNGTGNGKDHTA